MTENSTPKSTGTPRWLKIVLIISLAANLGIAGVIGGVALKGPEQRRNAGPAPFDVAMFARAMPFEHQRALRQEWRGRHSDAQTNRRVMMKLREQLIIALRADPFDLDAVSEAFLNHRELVSTLTQNGHIAIVDQIGQMSPKERAIFINRLLGNDRPAAKR